MKLTLAAAVVSCAMALAFAPSAGATATVALGADVITVTENTTSIGATIALGVDPVGPGAADDVLVVSGQPNWTASGCTPNTGTTVRCPLTAARRRVVGNFNGSTSTYTVSVDLDRPELPMSAAITGNGPLLDGSATVAGDLALTGFTTMRGGGGDDSLTGTGTVNNTLSGGAGDDAFTPGLGLDDTVDGGPGTQDTLSYAAETVPVSASLNGADDDGPQGRRTHINGIENVSGGQAGDLITGDAGFNHLSGDLGDDVVDGGGGGHDVLRGGLGNDQLRARDVPALFSDVACSAGNDSALVDFLDVVAPDCESVDRTGPAAGTADDTAAPAVSFVKLRGRVTVKALRRLRVRVALSAAREVLAELIGTTRRARISALRDNLTLARRSLPLGGGTRSVTLKPPRGLLTGARSVLVRITAADAAGNERRVQKRLRVKRRRS